MVGDPPSCGQSYDNGAECPRELDCQCQSQAKAAGMNVEFEQLPMSHIHLSQREVMDVFQRQLVQFGTGASLMIQNMFHTNIQVGSINFHS